MFLISNAYAQTAAPASGGADLSFLYIAGLMLVVVFFTTMRPQMKKARRKPRRCWMRSPRATRW